MTYEWLDRAACAGFRPQGTNYQRHCQVKALCRSCPVWRECLAWAIETDVTDGVWGGLEPAERQRLARRRAS